MRNLLLPIHNNLGEGFCGSVSTVVGGFPTLLVIDPYEANQSYPAKIQVLVAAWMPGFPPGDGSAPQRSPHTDLAFRQLGKHGFSMEIQQAGVQANLAPERIALYIEDRELTDSLGVVAQLVASYTVGLGGRPASAIP